MATDTKRKNAVVIHKGEDGVYVSVPEYNKLGHTHEGASINGVKFEPGKTYYLAKDWAEELERILSVYDEATLRLLMGRINRRALSQLRQTDFASIE